MSNCSESQGSIMKGHCVHNRLYHRCGLETINPSRPSSTCPRKPKEVGGWYSTESPCLLAGPDR